MCFNDEDSYSTRAYVNAGHRHSRYERVGYGMSWRRRNGLGGSYYPSAYYRRPPGGQYVNNMVIHPSRNYHHSSYPRGVMPGGYARGVGHQNYYSTNVVPGGYARGHGYGYGGRYFGGARATLPAGALTVRRFSLYCPRFRLYLIVSSRLVGTCGTYSISIL